MERIRTDLSRVNSDFIARADRFVGYVLRGGRSVFDPLESVQSVFSSLFVMSFVPFMLFLFMLFRNRPSAGVLIGGK
jgi:hypothetical protein